MKSCSFDTIFGANKIHNDKKYFSLSRIFTNKDEAHNLQLLTEAVGKVTSNFRQKIQ